MYGIIKHDILSGILLNYKKFIIIAIIIILELGLGWRDFSNIYGINNMTFAEGLGYIWAGNIAFVKQIDQNGFQIPINWFVLNLFIYYIICSYPLNDWKNSGANIIIRCKSRYKWWIGKIIWAMLVILVIGIIEIICTLFITGGFKKNMLLMRPEGGLEYGQFAWKLNSMQKILVLIIVPLVVIFLLSIIQMVVMFILNEIVAYSLMLFLGVLSSFFNSFVCIMPFTMVIRTSEYTIQNNIVSIMISCIIISMLLILSGMYIIHHKDNYGN